MVGKPNSPNTKRAAAKAATRATIIAAATEMFAAEGYEPVTMRRIASKIRMSTGALFGNFAGKAEIYREIYGHDPITPEQGRALMLEVAALRKAA